ncbi:MAG: DUF2203 domain-containing protein [Nitriliruptoraceae bacterium]|nr:DUF2203 domain-containing protein [Nitriliruptoraceae bacterium]
MEPHAPTTRYRLDEAQAVLPEARRQVARIAALVSDLQRLLMQLRTGRAPASAVEEASVLEAAVDEAVAWFDARSIQIKSLSPALLDVPARAIRDGEPVEVLLCWREDEDAIAYYHDPEGGYATREPVALLDDI